MTQAVDRPVMPRSGSSAQLPSALPTGWFQVAWSADIGERAVVPLHYFGRDLVAFLAFELVEGLAVLSAMLPDVRRTGWRPTVRG